MDLVTSRRAAIGESRIQINRFKLKAEKINIMKGKYYTFFIASSASGGMRRVRVPFYVLHALAILAAVGGVTVLAGMGSYSRMLWKATNYNSLRREQDSLKQQYKQLQTEVKDTNQRLNSLQSLASEVAMAYGLTRFQQTPFGITDVNEGTSAEFPWGTKFMASVPRWTGRKVTAPAPTSTKPVRRFVMWFWT